MEKKFQIIFSFSLLLCITSPLYITAQEVIKGIEVNSAIKNHLKLKSSYPKLKKYQDDTLEVPFQDDFTKTKIFPDENLWSDRYAFINSTYAVNPVSFNVATLDAIDSDGTMYTDANTTSFIADHLTSNPINLYYPGDSTVFLSFFYQSQGLGDNPEEKDSLIVDFYSPVDSIWYSVWKVPGDTLMDFELAMIQITDSIFLKKGFQFRFKNYASFSDDSDEKEKRANVDHWNIDYVILDTARSKTDTIIHDVCFARNVRSLLNSYESMPWEHFKEAYKSEMEDTIIITYKNNDSITRNITREFEIIDQYTSFSYSFPGGAVNINPFEIIEYETSLGYTFGSSSQDSAEFDVKCYLITDDFDYKWNDTIHYLQKFYNYYSYDDGSAEMGYGLSNDGTQSSSVAYRFFSHKADTLQAIQMYFNQTLNDATGQIYFYLTVWDDNAGKPGNVIYSQSGFKPEYEDSLNQFHIYQLDTSIIVSGTFYIGWTQTTSSFLNVGWDNNRINNDKIFYTSPSDGQWYNSSFAGSLMIRPVVGKPFVITSINTSYEDLYTIYPNPANDYFYISYPRGLDTKPVSISLYNNLGKLVYSFFGSTKSIDVSSLPDGIYFLRITDFTNNIINKRLIITH